MIEQIHRFVSFQKVRQLLPKHLAAGTGLPVEEHVGIYPDQPAPWPHSIGLGSFQCLSKYLFAASFLSIWLLSALAGIESQTQQLAATGLVQSGSVLAENPDLYSRKT